MRVATLDLGSNTFLCLIADIDKNGQLTVVRDLAQVVRLGQGVLQNEVFHPEALERAKDCLEVFAQEIKAAGAERVLALATAAARKAKNRDRLEQILNDLKIPFRIISGDEEATLTFLGAQSGISSIGTKVVIDIGGGSTEITIGDEKGIHFRQSFEIGVVRLREQYINAFPISKKISNEIQQDIQNSFEHFENIPKEKGPIEVIGVAGTPTTLAAAVLGGFDPFKVDGFEFSLDDLLGWELRLNGLTPQEIEEVYSVPKGRSDVLSVGVMILIAGLKALKKDRLKVSVRGLRYGAAYELHQNVVESSKK